MKVTQFVLALCLGALLSANPAYSQAGGDRLVGESVDTMQGTVVSLTSNTMTVRLESGEYQLFAFDRDAAMPTNLKQGDRVVVRSRPYERNVRMAQTVTMGTDADRPSASADSSAQANRDRARRNQSAGASQDQPGGNTATTRPGAGSDGAANSQTANAQPTDDPIPPEVRRVERQIERQARRFQAGVHAGAGLDPEILIGGVHAQLGPIFNENVRFRPSLELGLGEVSTFVAFNLEALYRLPLTERQGRWSAYVGGGPGLNLIDQNFKKAELGEREIDFDDLDFDPSMNFIAGVEFRSGMFVELKSAAFGRPHTRIMFGVHF